MTRPLTQTTKCKHDFTPWERISPEVRGEPATWSATRKCKDCDVEEVSCREINWVNIDYSLNHMRHNHVDTVPMIIAHPILWKATAQ